MISSLVSDGCIVSGASLRRTLLSTGARVNSFADVEYAVILSRVDVGRSARLRNVVIDADVKIPEGLVVGEDPELDAKRFRRTERGICLITQSMIDRLLMRRRFDGYQGAGLGREQCRTTDKLRRRISSSA